MRHVEKIFFSGTFAGETLSLISCLETIKFMKRKKSISKNVKYGTIIKKSLNSYINNLKLNDILELSGHPSWLFFKN